MQFDVGLFDRLFGKRTRMDVPMPDGSIKTVMVTQAWFDRCVAEGKLERVDDKRVTFFLNGTDGYTTGSLVIGKDISEEDHAKFVDPKTGGIYGIQVYEKGVKQTSLVSKQIWDMAKAKLDALG